MTDQPLIEGLHAARERLRAAQRTGDIAELDGLLHEDYIHTGPPTGTLETRAKEIVLEHHRSRRQAVTGATEEILAALVVGTTGVVSAVVHVAGTYDGEPFYERLQSTTTWVHTAEHGWRVLATHTSLV